MQPRRALVLGAELSIDARFALAFADELSIEQLFAVVIAHENRAEPLSAVVLARDNRGEPLFAVIIARDNRGGRLFAGVLAQDNRGGPLFAFVLAQDNRGEPLSAVAFLQRSTAEPENNGDGAPPNVATPPNDARVPPFGEQLQRDFCARARTNARSSRENDDQFHLTPESTPNDATDWGRIRVKLVLFPVSRTKSRETAEELAHDAIAGVSDVHWQPWDPKKCPSLEVFLTGLVRRLASHARGSVRVHREISIDLTANVPADGRNIAKTVRAYGDPAPTPERRYVAGKLYAQKSALVRMRLAGDQISVEPLDCWERGVDTPADQAAATGHPIEDIRRATRRFFVHAEEVARELPATGDTDESSNVLGEKADETEETQ